MTLLLSAAVAAGTDRPEQVAALAGRLRALDPVRVVHADPATALVRAWRAAAGTGSTHHLVVRDGARLAPEFAAELARAVAGRPRAALALHVEYGSWNAAAARLAALRGCGWAAAVPQDCLSPLALLLPSELAVPFAEFANVALAAGGPPNALLSRFAREHRLDVLIHVGNLAAGPVDSLLRPAAQDCDCSAALPYDGRLRDEVSPLPAVLPLLHGGRARISLWDPGTDTWRRATWSAHMDRIGGDWPGAAPAAAFVAITDRVPPPARERLLPLTEVVRYGLALGAALGRAPAESAAPTLRPWLCAAVLDAVGPVPARGWPDAWTTELTDVLWRAVGLGARLQANHGVRRWSGPQLARLPVDAPLCGAPDPAAADPCDPIEHGPDPVSPAWHR
ncbi:hypothetical protein AB0K51_29160 [Kitasatospora sp. NPDC049285]|uniref:hypothetical protein n=1 Tax=Kitasatospora sp. NPDC049285 TaxID=3157096 RepID=UPI00342A647F